METNNRSTIMPVLVIFAGILFQMQAMGLLGEKGQVMEIAWPVLLIAAGLDLFFGYKRILGAALLLFTGIALILFNISGSTSEVWGIFIAFWPIMLILFGLDMLLSGNSLTGSLFLILILAIVVYAILGAKGIVPIPDVPLPEQTLSAGVPSTSAPNNQATRQIDYILPSEPLVALDLQAAGGKFQLKSDALENRILTGTITLSAGEQINEDYASQNSAVKYRITSSGGGSASSSVWDLKVHQGKQIQLAATMENGYQMVDLRGFQLASAMITNKNGNIDVMLPFSAQIPINISAQAGNIRIYIPQGVSVTCTISGSGSVSYPENYIKEGSSVYSREPSGNTVTVNVQTTNGSIKLISAQGQ